MESLLNCKSCSIVYNLERRVPVYLPCCGRIACKECYMTQMCTLNGKQLEFLCLFCHKEITEMSELGPKMVQDIIEILKMQPQPLNIVCNFHPQAYVEYYCRLHRELVCKGCAEEGFHSHGEVYCQKIKKGEIQEFLEDMYNRLRVKNERIVSVLDELYSFKERQIEMVSSEFIALANEACELLGSQVYFNDQERKQESMRGTKQTINLRDSAFFTEIDKYKDLKLPELSHRQELENIDSTLIKHQRELKILKGFFESENIRLNLLYRGTDHGFNREAFARRCNSKGPTVILIKSEMGKIFGGYTSVSWSTPKGGTSDWKYHIDEEAFLFSLTYGTKQEVYRNEEFAVRHSPSDNILMFVFGSTNSLGVGCDLVITEKCNQGKNSYSDLGGTFETPLYRKGPKSGRQIMPTGSKEARSYLAGEYKFRVKEIEVFQVKFD